VHDESELDEVDLADVPFGRNQLARVLGTALFGSVGTVLLRSAPAEAKHQSTPAYCDPGFPRCHQCYQETCSANCYGPQGQCRSGGNCWNTCRAHTLWRCCDWRERYPGTSTHACTCRGNWGWC
jgi:hypothetical protein